MSDLFERINSGLDGIIKRLEDRIEERDKKVREVLKDNPGMLLRWENACFKLDRWMEANPGKCPPDAEYFLK